MAKMVLFKAYRLRKKIKELWRSRGKGTELVFEGRFRLENLSTNVSAGENSS